MIYNDNTSLLSLIQAFEDATASINKDFTKVAEAVKTIEDNQEVIYSILTDDISGEYYKKITLELIPNKKTGKIKINIIARERDL